MITCPNCSKPNQDHYKFCLACGTKLMALPADGSGPIPVPPEPVGSPPPPPPVPDGSAMTMPAPSSYRGQTRESVDRPSLSSTEFVPREELEAAMAAARAEPSGAHPGSSRSETAGGAERGMCPSCAFANPDGFKFCGRCGTALPSAASPPPPPPAADSGASVGHTAYAPPRDDDAGRGGGGRQPPAAASVARTVFAPSAAVEAPHGAAARLIMLGPDGQPVGERMLHEGEALGVGRDSGPPWEDDSYLDPRHAALTFLPERGVRVEDFGSVNGIFLKLTGRVEIQQGDQFRVGQELLLYEDLPEPTPTDDGTERMGSPNPGYWGRVSVLVDPDRPSMAFPIEGEGITVGREQGDITFPQDGYVSGSHCRIIGDENGIYIEDLGSSNGTYMRVRSGQVVPFSSLILIGQKLFQVERAG